MLASFVWPDGITAPAYMSNQWHSSPIRRLHDGHSKLRFTSREPAGDLSDTGMLIVQMSRIWSAEPKCALQRLALSIGLFERLMESASVRSRRSDLPSVRKSLRNRRSSRHNLATETAVVRRSVIDSARLFDSTNSTRRW